MIFNKGKTEGQISVMYYPRPQLPIVSTSYQTPGQYGHIGHIQSIQKYHVYINIY